MTFGTIFSKSWKDYKSNFKALSLAMLVFYAVGFFIAKLVSSILISATGYNVALEGAINGIFANGNMANLTSVVNELNVQYASALSHANIYPSILIFIASLIYFLVFVGIGYSYLKNDKISFKGIYENGKKFYWVSLGFSIVFVLLLLGLYVLLIIPGIIFTIYWVVALFCYFDNKDNGYINALEESFRLVKNRWWKTFGYLILLFLIIFVIYIIFSIPSIILGVISVTQMIGGNYSASFNLLVQWVGFITQTLASFIVVPLSIMFTKNLYSEYKTKKA